MGGKEGEEGRRGTKEGGRKVRKEERERSKEGRRGRKERKEGEAGGYNRSKMGPLGVENEASGDSVGGSGVRWGLGGLQGGPWEALGWS